MGKRDNWLGPHIEENFSKKNLRIPFVTEFWIRHCLPRIIIHPYI